MRRLPWPNGGAKEWVHRLCGGDVHVARADADVDLGKADELPSFSQASNPPGGAAPA
jgi:hypothetical protein